jgi:XTP/dITP diphosphohydrolase
VLALIDPLGDSEAPTVVEGRCEGKILLTPRGGLGFGYDPLFEVEGTNKTLAEMTSAEKNAVSHRSSALTRLRPFLAQILAARSSVVAGVANAQ